MKVLVNIFILSSFFLTNCNKEGPSPLHGCCDNPPIADTLGNTDVYVPNIFTPNGDGLNDLLTVYGDSIARIVSFEIRSSRGNVVFQAEDVLQTDPGAGWDGKVAGVLKKGLYSIKLIVEADDGTTGAFHGSVCNFPCGLSGDEERISSVGCHFGNEWHCWLFDDGCLNLDYEGCFD